VILTYTVDTTAPTVSSVSSSKADGSYTTATLIPITVTFSEVVKVSGTPQLTLETGTTDRIADYTSGTGTATLTFNYTVQSGDTSPDLDYVDTSSLALNGGTITDKALNTATLTLPAPGASGSLGANKAIIIDTTAPTITIDTKPADPTNSTSAAFTFTTSTDTSSVECKLDSGVFAACSTSTSQSYGSLTEGSHIFYIQATDVAGNTGSNSYTWEIDLTSPTILISSPSETMTASGPVTYNVTYTDTNFNTSTLAVGNITLNKTGSANGTVEVSGTGTTRTVTIKDTAGDGTLGISIAAGTASDTAGNLAPAAGPSETFQVSSNAPTINHLTPNSGPMGGGTSVTISGTKLGGTLQVIFGGNTATCDNNLETSITCITPQHAAGAVDVTLTTSYGTATAYSAFTYLKSDQTITFTSAAPTNALVGGTYTPTASATSGNSVVITVDSSASSVCSISAEGVVSFTGAGTCVLDANQAGDTLYNAAPQVQQSFTVSKVSQTISFTSVAPGSAQIGGAYVPTATATSGLAVTLTIDSSASAVCSISSGTVNFNANGICVIDANQAGNSTYSAATQVKQSFIVGVIDQAITFTSTAPASATYGDAATYKPTATSTSGLTVTITVDSSARQVCVISSAGVVSYKTPGNCVLDANQAGNSQINPAPQVQQTFSIAKATLTVTAAGIDKVYDGNTSATVTLSDNRISGDAFDDYYTSASFLDPAVGTNKTVNVTGISIYGPAAFKYQLANTTATTKANILTDNGPKIVDGGVYVVLSSRDVQLYEGRSVTVDITALKVTFDKVVVHVGSSDPDYGHSATNPANYLLVDADDDGFQTISCKNGLSSNDKAITIDSITYSDASPTATPTTKPTATAKHTPTATATYGMPPYPTSTYTNPSANTGPFTVTLKINNGKRLSKGDYRLFVCGSTSVTDLVGVKLAGDGIHPGTDFSISFSEGERGAGYSASKLPSTGFAPKRETVLSEQPADKAYAAMGNVWMEIPKLGLEANIVGVPLTDEGTWDVTWLNNDAGWLEGSAFPSYSGNSVLTGHYWNSLGSSGPFRYIYSLVPGDKIIVHAYGEEFEFTIRSVDQVKSDVTADKLLQHKDTPWLTLVTCRGYLANNNFLYRVIVTAEMTKGK
jgi:LPXTG-site transpeptidase (sortase) family protein